MHAFLFKLVGVHNYKMNILPLEIPLSMIIAGPSFSGKSTFVTKLINNSAHVCEKKFDKVIWCFAEANAKPDNIQIPVEYIIGLPDIDTITPQKNTVVVLDDLMHEAANVKISELFTRGSHHRNLSVILITQNLFHKGSHTRDISLNAKYIVVFNNPRDKLQFQYLARQIYPENSKDLLNIFRDITEEPHSYLLIDLTQRTENFLRFRTDIFKRDYCTVICCRPNGFINGETVACESVGETQAFAVCVKRCKTTTQTSNFKKL